MVQRFDFQESSESSNFTRKNVIFLVPSIAQNIVFGKFKNFIYQLRKLLSGETLNQKQNVGAEFNMNFGPCTCKQK